MKIKNISLALCALFTMFSCSEDEIELFNATPSINMAIVDSKILTIASDTLVTIDYGFLDTRIVDSTRTLRCKLQGLPVNYARTVKLLYSGTAVVESDYVAASEVVIEAGKIDADIPIKVFRKNLAKDGAKRLTIEMIPSAEIVKGVITRVHLDFADEVPSKWVNEMFGMMATNNLGPCTKTKYRFFYDIMGFYDFKLVTMGDYTVLKNVMNQKLADYNANPAKYDNKFGPSPMMNDDGVTVVSF